jgi:hypothetical protein
MKTSRMRQHIIAIGSSTAELGAVLYRIFDIARKVFDLKYLLINNIVPVSLYEYKHTNKYNSRIVLRLLSLRSRRT